MDLQTPGGMPRPRLWIFDLGDTLYDYVGVPLNWERHYPEALASLARHWGLRPTVAQLAEAAGQVRRFNTRLNPRLREVDFRDVAGPVAARLGLPGAPVDLAAARAFFGVFRQHLAPFPDAVPMLVNLHESGFRIAALTDVPYGMPRDLVEDDLREAGLLGRIDRVVTSVDVGWRKPSPEGLRWILASEGARPHDAVYVGNERKDIDAAKAAGMRAVLIDREALAPEWGQDVRCTTLSELVSL